MAGRGRGATLPAWMADPVAPGALREDAASLPAASNPPADTGRCLHLNKHLARWHMHLRVLSILARAGPSYTPDIVEAAQAQILQEQDAALQQVLAMNGQGYVLSFWQMSHVDLLRCIQSVPCRPCASVNVPKCPKTHA